MSFEGLFEKFARVWVQLVKLLDVWLRTLAVPVEVCIFVIYHATLVVHTGDVMFYMLLTDIPHEHAPII